MDSAALVVLSAMFHKHKMIFKINRVRIYKKGQKYKYIYYYYYYYHYYYKTACAGVYIYLFHYLYSDLRIP